MEDLRYNRNFWIQVNETSNPKKRAHVKAEKKESEFRIKTKNVKNLSLLLNDLYYNDNEEYKVIINGKSLYQGPFKMDKAILLESLNTEIDYAKIYGVKLDFKIN